MKINVVAVEILQLQNSLPLHGSSEGAGGAGARLVEETREDLALKQIQRPHPPHHTAQLQRKKKREWRAISNCGNEKAQRKH